MRGKIYKMISEHTEEIYVGSTSQKLLSQRMNKHRQDYKGYLAGLLPYMTSFDIMKHDDATLILLESLECKDRDELRAREQYWIDQLKENTVNKLKAYRSEEEFKKQHNEAQKRYYEKNKEELKEKHKDYYKQYREENKEKLYAKRSVVIECECGLNTTKLHKHRHEQTQRHKDLMEKKNLE